MAAYSRLPFRIVEELNDVANRIRLHSVTSTDRANSGHPTSCSSIAEILTVLFFNAMHFRVSILRDPCSDRLVLSKGHAAPALYAVWAEVGLFPTTDLMKLRKFGSDFEGHPTPNLEFIDVATGSLGQGLSHAAGMAYIGKYFDKAGFRVYCICGDEETSEGSFWEAANFCSYYELDNLCVIVDVNRLGQSEETAFGYDCEVYRKRFDAFGFFPIIVDGHSIDELCKSFHNANLTKLKPSVLIAKTVKGKNFPSIEDEEHWHGKPLGEKAEDVIKHLKRMIRNTTALKVHHPKPDKDSVPRVHLTNIQLSSAPMYKLGDMLTTRAAYATGLIKLGQTNARIVVLDADVKNTTHTVEFKNFDHTRFVQCFSAEQCMIGVGVGMCCRGRAIVFCATYAAMLTRAFDMIRMAAISQSTLNIAGCHCGVSVGEDGPCKMGLEDLALFRSIPNCTIFYPCDAVSTERAVELAANTTNITYIRLTRPATPIVHSLRQEFEIGKAIILRENIRDTIMIIAAGITLHEALKTYDELLKLKIFVRIMDPFTIKPIDKEGILKHGRECNNRILVVEDHYYEGGLGEAVKSAVAGEEDFIIEHIAVGEIPRSGSMIDLMDYFHLNVKGIMDGIGKLSCICQPCY